MSPEYIIQVVKQIKVFVELDIYPWKLSLLGIFSFWLGIL